jgi:hypothetical protein
MYYFYLIKDTMNNTFSIVRKRDPLPIAFLFYTRVNTATHLRTFKIFYLKIDNSFAHDEISCLPENK